MKSKIIDNNSGAGDKPALRREAARCMDNYYPSTIMNEYITSTAQEMSREVDADIIRQMMEKYVGMVDDGRTQAEMNNELSYRLKCEQGQYANYRYGFKPLWEIGRPEPTYIQIGRLITNS